MRLQDSISNLKKKLTETRCRGPRFESNAIAGNCWEVLIPQPFYGLLRAIESYMLTIRVCELLALCSWCAIVPLNPARSYDEDISRLKLDSLKDGYSLKVLVANAVATYWRENDSLFGSPRCVIYEHGAPNNATASAEVFDNYSKFTLSVLDSDGNLRCIPLLGEAPACVTSSCFSPL